MLENIFAVYGRSSLYNISYKMAQEVLDQKSKIGIKAFMSVSIMEQGLFKLPAFGQRIAEIYMHFGIVRGNAQSHFVLGYCLLGIALRDIRIPKIIIRFGKLWINGDGLFKVFNRLIHPALVF